MCRNSLGPCALLPGPKTPVTTNCALGKRSPSIPMKLDEIKCKQDHLITEYFHPLPPKRDFSYKTNYLLFLLRGEATPLFVVHPIHFQIFLGNFRWDTWLYRIQRRLWRHREGSVQRDSSIFQPLLFHSLYEWVMKGYINDKYPSGIRKESLIAVKGLKTFPPTATGGTPSIPTDRSKIYRSDRYSPTIASWGLQFLLRRSSLISSVTGFVPVTGNSYNSLFFPPKFEKETITW